MPQVMEGEEREGWETEAVMKWPARSTSSNTAR